MHAAIAFAAALLAPGGRTDIAAVKPDAVQTTAEAGSLEAAPLPRKRDGSAPRGLQALNLEGDRDGLVYVPTSYKGGRPAPLLVMLHGAGAAARDILRPFIPLADLAGLVLVAPDSRGPTWDIILGAYGPDVRFIDRTLIQMFGQFNLDPDRIGIGGFSDGASYALSLGLTNGQLFTHVVAFSPGFTAVTQRRGMPRVFISHGVADRVLPTDACSRKIVRTLERAGYDVDYREFEGGHVIPPTIARAALRWLLD